MFICGCSEVSLQSRLVSLVQKRTTKIHFRQTKRNPDHVKSMAAIL